MSIRMVDVSGKGEIVREAVARGCIKLRRETIERIRNKDIEKGDVLTASALVAIQGVKKTPELLPFCHPLRIDHVDTHFELYEDRVCVEVKVRARERTGVEMEALVGASLALLNIWDMVKKYEKDERGQYPYTAIENIIVVRKVKRDEETL